MQLVWARVERLDEKRKCGCCGHTRGTGKLRLGGVLHLATLDEAAFRDLHCWRGDLDEFTERRRWSIERGAELGWLDTACGQGANNGLRPATPEEIESVPLCKMCQSRWAGVPGLRIAAGPIMYGLDEGGE